MMKWLFMPTRYTSHRGSEVCYLLRYSFTVRALGRLLVYDPKHSMNSCFDELKPSFKAMKHWWRSHLPDFVWMEVFLPDSDIVTVAALWCWPWLVPALSSQGRCGTPGWCHLGGEACIARWNYWEKGKRRRGRKSRGKGWVIKGDSKRLERRK